MITLLSESFYFFLKFLFSLPIYITQITFAIRGQNIICLIFQFTIVIIQTVNIFPLYNM